MEHLSSKRDAILNYPLYQPIGKAMDWEKMDEFVKDHVEGLISTVGKSTLEQAIREDDPNSGLTHYLGYIIEIGGTLLLSKNTTFTSSDLNNKKLFCLLTAVTMDLSLKHYLQHSNVYYANVNYYYNQDTVTLLSSHIMKHHQEANSLSENFTSYSKSVYSTFMKGLVNGVNEKWLKL